MSDTNTLAKLALEKWGRHHDWCPRRVYPFAPCLCGLAATIASLAAPASASPGAPTPTIQPDLIVPLEYHLVSENNAFRPDAASYVTPSELLVIANRLRAEVASLWSALSDARADSERAARASSSAEPRA